MDTGKNSSNEQKNNQSVENEKANDKDAMDSIDGSVPTENKEKSDRLGTHKNGTSVDIHPIKTEKSIKIDKPQDINDKVEQRNDQSVQNENAKENDAKDSTGENVSAANKDSSEHSGSQEETSNKMTQTDKLFEIGSELKNKSEQGNDQSNKVRKLKDQDVKEKSVPSKNKDLDSFKESGKSIPDSEGTTVDQPREEIDKKPKAESDNSELNVKEYEKLKQKIQHLEEMLKERDILIQDLVQEKKHSQSQSKSSILNRFFKPKESK
ncbi:IgA FC receptor-like [Mercenaria mercenaria]|uniref:IgA FC receptor-like n=1 Tax=Mercenaria mercenaria TaxID=6596 RepID=UPI00234F2375|nr:IgA FC receptor-like [Mercenaria mercenaria]